MAKAVRKAKKAAKGKQKAPADLRTMVAVAAWSDPKFAALVKKKPAAAVAQLAKEYNIKVPRGVKFKTVKATGKDYHLYLLPNPAGELKTARLEAGPGGIRSITADCWCGNTTTGRCSCGSIAGTPCLGCRTSTSRCYCN